MTTICRILPRCTQKCSTIIPACRGKQKVSLSNAFSLLKSRILPRFAAICRAYLCAKIGVTMS